MSKERPYLPALAVVALVLAFALGWLARAVDFAGPPPPDPGADPRTVPPLERDPVPEPKIEYLADLAIVIDDVGRRSPGTASMASLGRPVTFSVLPFQTYTRAEARDIADLGHEILLHLPMEPKDPDRDPGPGAVTTGLEAEEVRRIVREDLSEVPGAVGVNNHMGSLATEDRELMREVLGVIKEEGLFFLDSRTTSGSVAFDVARDLGVPAAENYVFIDNVKEVGEIRARVREAAEKALGAGSAVAIGHPGPETAAVLAEMVQELDRMRVRMAYLSEIIELRP